MSVTLNVLETTALDRVLKARAELIMTQTFYGVLLSQVVPVISTKVKTAATNGKQHYWNPEFINSLKKNHKGVEVPVQRLVLGVQAHENEHDARRHHTRRGNRDPKEWNIACDYSINCDLIDQGFDLPEKALIDRKYKGMSAEDVYRAREIDRALQKQKEEEEKQKQEEEEQNDETSNDADTDGEEITSGNADDGMAEEDGDESETSDSSGADENTADDGESDDESQADTSDDGGEDGSPEEDSVGSASGNSEGEPSGEGVGEADGEGVADLTDAPETAPSDDAGEAGEPVSCGDPGNCGEVLDAADDTAEMAGEDARWETIIRQAAMLAAKRGTAPSHVAREIEHADHPPQDWRETLRAFYDAGALVQETWSRPNRRFIGSGLYLPGHERDGVNKAVMLIDTSGSVTYYPGALEAIKAETQAALDDGVIDELVVIYGDVCVTRVDTYRHGDEIEFDPRGGGGTCMKPLFDYVREEIVDASLIVAFTDLEIEPDLGDEPACPVLWAAVGYPDRVKQYLKETPWGAPGIEVVPSYN